MSIYDKASLVLIPSGTKTSKVYSQKPVPEYGAELVTNGGFSSGTGWSLSSGWSIASGKATASSTNNNLQTSTSIVTGDSKYLVSFEISNYSSGTLYVDLGTSSSRELYTSSGFKSIVLTAGGFNKLRFYGGSISCDIDNVSVKEVLVEDGDFTFSRSTAATRVNADGNIEKETQNLLLQSNTFDTTWINVGSTLTSGQSGYDGSNAWKVEASSAVQRLEQNIASQGVATYSMYAKAGNVSLLRVQTQTAGTDVFFDLSNGTIPIQEAAAFDATITDVGSGWYRCTMSVNETISNLRFLVQRSAFSVTIGDFLYVQDAQLEQGLVARDYIETTTAAVEGGITDNVPRLDYTDSSCPALLLEPQRTNVLTHSEYFGGWGQINTLNTANALISPEGVQNANKLIAASGVNNNVINQQISAGTYTASVFAKKGEFEGLFIGSGPTGAFFNLNTYAYRTHYQSAPTSYKIEDYGNGWHRYSITFTISGNDSLYIGPNDNVSNTLGVTGNNSNGIYIFGATLEVGAYETSYIPTYGTSVTRNGDSCLKTGVSDIVGQTEGTLFFDVNISRVVGNEAIGTINSGAYANHATIQRVGSTIQFVRNSATQSGATIVTSATITAGRYKLAIAYKSGDTACFLNGAQVSTTQTQTFTNATLNAVKIGTDAIGALPISDSVKQALLFKTRLSNEELAALTTI